MVCKTMHYLQGSTDQDESLLPIAVAAALVTAAIELPISQFYATTPRTSTPARMTIAGGMAFVSVLIGGSLLKMFRR